jgi:predicted DNA-binding transcriptional regulator YafY
MARLESLGATVLQAAHDTAEPETDGGWTRITIPIESIDQAAWDMLKLGSEAEVLKPVALRRRVAKAARDVARLNS